ncbi:uncharacterized protein PSFLO_02712 [Pseudozyma flocculosa]|nr:uncharacterized protein PSFLO_02712 [Pseudozyma flocculosa]
MSFPGSGANSPALGSNRPPHMSQPNAGQSMTAPGSPSGAYTASALAYANAQLSQFAATGGAAALPAHLNPHALSSALSEYSMSMPNSAASSPGATPRRLPGTGTSTPGGNSRVAASAITGKRLNWSEMICQTIAESESGRLVIQDLFEGMCAKFPEIREWAFGKDWEARVKNRIKSTLSIKGNLFIKVPRPSSAAGKGSWWTLSAEAQEAWKTGRVANVVKNNNSHSRAASAGPSSIHGSPVRTVSAKFGGSAAGHTPNPPYMIQNSHTHQNHSHRTSPLGLGLNSTPSGHLKNSYGNFGFGEGLVYGSNQGIGSDPTGANSGGGNFNNGNGVGNVSSDAPQMPMAQPSQGGMLGTAGTGNDTQPNLQLKQEGGGGQNVGADMMSGAPSQLPAMSGADFSGLGFFSAEQPLGAAQSVAHLGGPQSMPFPASSSNQQSGMGDFGPLDSADYSALFEGFAGLVSSNGGDLGLGGQQGMGMGSPFDFQNAPHPFGGSIPGAYTLLQNQSSNNSGSATGGGNGSTSSLGQFAGFGAGSPYGSFGGTPMPGQPGGGSGASGSGTSGQTPSAPSDFGTTTSSSPFTSGGGGGIEMPSPADSTWFSYTPLVEPTNQAPGQNTSALGQLGGEGSKKRRASEGLKDIGELQLPPAEAGS